jgi:imidazolonepropionase
VRARAAGWVAIRAYATPPVSTPERISADLVICRLAQLATPGGETGQPLRGAALGDVEVHTGDMWIAAYAGEIVAVGHGYEIRDRLDLDDDATIIDAAGLVAVPGLIDCHTHACFGGDRLAEFEQRSRGASYEEIHASGGGILSTVRATRELSQPQLVEITRRHLAAMLEHGTTTIEVKSGYGLDAETEHSMLRASQEAGYDSAVHVVTTCLAAHAVPAEAESADAYITTCIDEILPDVSEWGLAEAVDVFVEGGAFDAGQARRYL